MSGTDEAVYLIDWKEGVITHPDYEYPPYGPGNRVTLDGKDVSTLRIQRLLTGEDGYIEYLFWPHVIGEDGNLAGCKVHGKVTWEFSAE